MTLNLAETQSSTKLAQAHRRSIKTLVTPQIEEKLSLCSSFSGSEAGYRKSNQCRVQITISISDSIQMVLMEETQDQKTDLYLYI